MMVDRHYTGTVPFERYDDEFSLLLQQIEKSLNEDPPSIYSLNLFQQAEDLLKQMALEARSVSDATTKRELLGQVRTLKSQLQTYQTQADKNNLLSTSSRNGQLTSAADKQKLLMQKNEDMLLNQNDTLERARRTMQETETVALEITEELGNNRETLMSAHARVREVGGLTGRAKKILQSMNQRAVQQKMVLYSVSIGLCVGFLLMLWFMWG